MKYQIAILLLSSATVLGQIATPTFNPFNNGMTPSYGFNQMMPRRGHYNQQRPNNNYGMQNNYQRPYNNGLQGNYQRPFNSFQNNGFQNNGLQNNGFQNNGFQNNGFQNNGLQQQNKPTQTNNAPRLLRRFYLNNGYLYGRPTLYYDPKSGAFQPWVRRNLR